VAITFQKRQREMKRREKQRVKAERREQRKLARRAQNEPLSQDIAPPAPTETQN